MLFSSLIVLEALLNQKSPEIQKELIAPLSEKTRHNLDITPLVAEQFDPSFFKKDELYSHIHYSWLLPFFKSLEKKDRSLFLSVLTDTTKEKIKNNLKIKKTPQNLSPLLEEYMQKKLLSTVFNKDEEILPKKYIPECKLTPLLELTKYEIVLLIDFLALSDLTIEKRKCISPKVFKAVDEYLSPAQKKFMAKIRRYKEEFTFPSLNLEKITLNKELFWSTLHKRGINRLSKALCSCHISFIWYICHLLDIGRGKSLWKLSEKKTLQKINETITLNIMDILSYIKT